MRTRRAFLATLFVAFVGLSLLADRGAARQRVITGTVIEWQAAELIAVALGYAGVPRDGADEDQSYPDWRVRARAIRGATRGSLPRVRKAYASRSETGPPYALTLHHPPRQQTTDGRPRPPESEAGSDQESRTPGLHSLLSSRSCLECLRSLTVVNAIHSTVYERMNAFKGSDVTLRKITSPLASVGHGY
jgi:hypothetical protein